MNVFRLSKVVNVPLRYVYEWCTDFSSEHYRLDGEPRRMLEVTKNRVIFIEVYTLPDGAQRMGVDLMTLRPVSSWHMDYFGQDNDESAEYILNAVGRDKTRIDMSFRNRWKGEMSLSTEEKRKIENEAWDGYIRTLEGAYRARKKRRN